jgi:hypothetical protein
MGGSQTGLVFAGQDIYLYDASGNEVFRFDCTHRKLIVPSGTSMEFLAGASASIPDASLEAADLALANGKILIGDAAGKAVACTPAGDVTISNVGATTIGATKVTAGMLANGAGLAALITAGLGASAAYIKTTNGAQTLLAQSAAARVVLLVAVVTEVFADAGGTQPVFVLGETTTPAKYDDGTALHNAALGAVKCFAGTLTATKALLVTASQAVGAGTGAVSVTAFVLPA